MANQKRDVTVSGEHQEAHDQMAAAFSSYHATLSQIAQVEEECRQKRAIIAAVAAQDLGARADKLRVSADSVHRAAASCW